MARNALAGKERRSSAGRLLVVPRSDRPRPAHLLAPPAPQPTPTAADGDGVGDASATVWLRRGANASLECLATANPTPASPVWIFNGSHSLAPSPGLVRFSFPFFFHFNDYRGLEYP